MSDTPPDRGATRLSDRCRRGLAAVALGLAVPAAQTTFDAIQPPDGRADVLRDQLEQVQKVHR